MSVDDLLTRPVPPPTRTVGYGADPAQVYDVRLPPASTDRLGTVLLVHGGFWRPAYDRAHAAPMAHTLTADGFAVAVVEYRRSGMPGGGFPGTFDDIRAASRAIAAEPEIGAGTGPLLAVGHSAGGHLVAWLAAVQGSGLAGTVPLAGCVDLTLTARLGLGAGAAVALMGGTPDELPEDYRRCDPTRRPPPEARVHLLHGEADHVVPIEVSRSYLTAHPGARLTGIPGADHFAVIDPEHPDFALVREAVRRLAEGADPAP